MFGSLIIVVVCSTGQFFYNGHNWQHPDDLAQCTSLLDENEKKMYEHEHEDGDEEDEENSGGGPIRGNSDQWEQ